MEDRKGRGREPSTINYFNFLTVLDLNCLGNFTRKICCHQNLVTSIITLMRTQAKE